MEAGELHAGTDRLRRIGGGVSVQASRQSRQEGERPGTNFCRRASPEGARRSARHQKSRLTVAGSKNSVPFVIRGEPPLSPPVTRTWPKTTTLPPRACL